MKKALMRPSMPAHYTFYDAADPRRCLGWVGRDDVTHIVKAEFYSSYHRRLDLAERAARGRHDAAIYEIEPELISVAALHMITWRLSHLGLGEQTEKEVRALVNRLNEIAK